MSPSETDAGTPTDADQPAVDIKGLKAELTCSSCGSHLDPLKIDEARCWLCGAKNFVDPTEAEIERAKKEAEKKEFCCPNPNCTRPLELSDRSEKYCAGCGAQLEKATPDVWFRKCVAPELERDAGKLFTGRAAFIDAAWRMGLTKEEAEIRLDDYNASNGDAPAARTVGKSQPEDEAVPPRPAGGTSSNTGTGRKSSTRQQAAQADDAQRLARLAHWLQESHRRQKEMRDKYRFGIICLVIIALVIILSNRRCGTIVKTENPVTPTPSPTLVKESATPSPQATPSPTPSLMVLIEGGEFQMGRNLKDGGDPYEAPSHPVTLKSFYIDVYEVTREEYQRCVSEGKCEKPSEWNGGTYPGNTGRLPVTGVTWDMAARYAAWAGKRLPTEEEWEFAARGPEERLYPWGNSWKSGHANVGGDGLAEVGSFKGTVPLKLFDMIGNAQEWTASEFRKYPDKKAYLLTDFPSAQLRVIRGGSYKDAAGKVTATYRNALRMSGENSYAQTGFRCARDAR